MEACILKKAATQYTSAKYAMAFTIAAMSDDDDDPDPVEGEPKRYASHAPDY